MEALLAFTQFKQLLTGAWQTAAALTALDAWQLGQSWAEVEAGFARWASAFTGVDFPPGFARLHPFVSAVSIYPAGYVLAEARVADWRPRLRALGGERWWAAPAVQADIRAHFQPGARITTAPARGWR